MHDGLAGTKNTFAVGITCRIGQVSYHVLLNFLRRIETKHGQIANVELDDLVALFLHLSGAVHDGAANVITNVGKFG